MARKVPLDIDTYNKKRDFKRTGEPKGRNLKGTGNSFVVQKHDASRLHWDFRLEMEGVLKSWAVPKGPSIDPDDKRLAVRTEDHPLDYADFEGTIPKGQYGGGAVVVWDRGTWHAEGDPHEAMQKGRLTFTLDGQKLHGRWHLIRTKPQDKNESWLLFKSRDEAASDKLDIITS